MKNPLRRTATLSISAPDRSSTGRPRHAVFAVMAVVLFAVFATACGGETEGQDQTAADELPFAEDEEASTLSEEERSPVDTDIDLGPRT